MIRQMLLCLLFFPAGLPLQAEPEFIPGWSASADEDQVRLKNRELLGETRVLTSLPGRNVLKVTRGDETLFTLGEVTPLAGVPGREPALRPGSIARRRPLRIAPSGSASVSLQRNAYVRVDTDEVVEGARSWWTVGSDASGRSGSPGLWVVVGGHDGFGLRPVHLPLVLHRLTKLTLNKNQFEAQIPGTDLMLRGTVLFPEEVSITQGKVDGKEEGVELRFWLRPPDEGNTFTWSGSGPLADLTLEEPDDAEAGPESSETPDMSTHIRRVIHAVSTSNAMGAPGLNRRVNNHLVLVLTLSTETPPDPRPGNSDDQVLFRMGDQTVRYWEHLIEFETGMRDQLAPAQGRVAP